jgi:hypothetical protein
MKPKDQRDALAVLVGVDTRELDTQIAELAEERKLHKRDVTAFKGDLDRLPLLTDAHRAAPSAEQSAAELSRQIAEALNSNGENDRQRRMLSGMVQDGKVQVELIDFKKKTIADLEKRISAERELLAGMETKLGTFREKYAEFKGKTESLIDQDVAPLNAQMATIEATNRLVRANEARAKAEKELDRLENEVSESTEAIDYAEKKRTELIAGAKFPVPGLSLTDEFVTFENIPLAQISSGKLIRISVRIAAAMNQKLRVALVREGSLLDEQAMANLCAEAEEIGLQLWIETCNRLHPATVVISDGHIKE